MISDCHEVYNTFKYMNEKKVVFVYTGTFEHDLVTSILKTVKRKMRLLNISKSLENKLYTVLVESAENVCRHASVSDADRNTGILMMAQGDNKFVIYSGNSMAASKVGDLEKRLMGLKNAGAKELKEQYRKQITAERLHENKAGLGLLEIALKTEGNFTYEFKEISKDKMFFLIRGEVGYKLNLI